MGILRKYKGQSIWELDWQARERLKRERANAADLRKIQAARRRWERESERKRRELAKQQKELEKLQELERAKYELEVYENRIECLLSVHKECGEVWDWKAIKWFPSPPEPEKSYKKQRAAQAELDRFKPGFFLKLFGLVESTRDNLIYALRRAEQTEEIEYQNSLQVYTEEYRDWQAITEIAKKILAGVPEAYLEAIEETEPFEDISDLGSSFEFKVPDKSTIEATIKVNSEQVIPSEVKTLLKSGKLSVKKMPKGQFYEIYQDYVCSCVLRVARELFALLPIHLVIVTAVGEFLNNQTGNMEEKTILSVAIPKNTFEKINFENLDPSDSMSNFVHHMKFKKTQGFSAVERIKLSDLN